MLIDAHAHLSHGKLFQQADAAVARAQAAGVGAILCAAGDVREAKTALGLARRIPCVFCTAGVHPHEAKHASEGFLSRIEDLLKQPECLALGEIGLDYHYDFSPRDVQRRVFAEQLALAARLDCPVVIHTREAFDDTMILLAESGVDGGRVVFHSFTGGPDEAGRVLNFGATLSFSGIATFKNAADIHRAVLLTPDDRILVETDCPYLSPEPVRNMKINEPANVVHVARRLAELRGCDFETFARQTTQNALGLFEGLTVENE
ncbi:MAG: TatD family hydrolase [Phycisphaerae bacterium]|nr:TatD family hydrolase [Phycisphaerae bacterium]